MENLRSFSEHNNNKLIDFLKGFEFDFIFKSSTEQYKSGKFNEGLEAIFDNYEDICNVILPTLGKDRRETYSPFCQYVKQVERFYKLRLKS